MKLPKGLEGYSLDHLGVAVHDLERASEPYRLLGLVQLGQDEEISSQWVRVRAFGVGESLLELLEPTSSDSPIASFLAKRGPGLHHLALRVDKLEPELKRLTALGAVFVNSEPRPGRSGTRVVFLHPRWTGGVLLELVEHGSGG